MILIWDVSNVFGVIFFFLVLEFFFLFFDFSDNFFIEVMFDGIIILDCLVNVDDIDIYNGILFLFNLFIQCGVGFLIFEIGDQGGYVANVDVIGNVEVDDFMVIIIIL